VNEHASSWDIPADYQREVVAAYGETTNSDRFADAIKAAYRIPSAPPSAPPVCSWRRSFHCHVRLPAMSEPAARARRYGCGEGSIYQNEAKGSWYAAVSVGYGRDGKTWRQQKLSGRARAEVAVKLRELQVECHSGTDMVRLDGRGPSLVGAW
jgi:hypothetical protein